jgi:hypothetical protein
MEASDDTIDREIMRQAMLQAARNQPPYQYLLYQHATALVLKERGFPVQANIDGPGLRRLISSRDQASASRNGKGGF